MKKYQDTASKVQEADSLNSLAKIIHQLQTQSRSLSSTELAVI